MGPQKPLSKSKRLAGPYSALSSSPPPSRKQTSAASALASTGTPATTTATIATAATTVASATLGPSTLGPFGSSSSDAQSLIFGQPPPPQSQDRQNLKYPHNVNFYPLQQHQQQRLVLQHQQHQAQIQVQHLQLQLQPRNYPSDQSPYHHHSQGYPLHPVVSTHDPLHPLHPLQFSPPHQQQQPQQHHHQQHLSSSSFSSPTPASLLFSSSTTFPSLTEQVPSMGVLGMPPLPLHSLQSFPSTSHALQQQSQQQQQQFFMQTAPRHYSLPNPDQVSDHFVLFQMHQQLQQPQQAHHRQQQAPQSQAPYSSSPVEYDISQPQSLSPARSNALEMMSSSSTADSTSSNNSSSCLELTKADSLLSHRTLAVPRAVASRPAESADDILRRFSTSSAGSSIRTKASNFSDENDSMSAYSLQARIIQKKDQLEELSTAGTVVPTPIVEEVRTGQQFLIKLHLVRNGYTRTSRFPSLRVGRREAINTAGEARSEPEPLTLEIAVRLAKGGQIRKRACAKCCHKAGPASPILQLLDPFAPSVSDPMHYSHVDTTTGSITMLAKVVCSSTDHGERGNKERYIFEFKLKRTSSMPAKHYDGDLSPAAEALEGEGEVISTCFTHPIMCSGHHKAKRTYPQMRPSKVTKAGPTPKMKTIKRHRSVPTIASPLQAEHQGGEPSRSINSAEPMASQNNSGFPATIPFLPDHFSQMPMLGSYPDRTDNGGLQTNDGHGANQQLMPTGQSALSMAQRPQPQQPSVSEIRPSHGPIRRKTDVIIRGISFREGMIPFFGFFPAQDVDLVSSSAIICKVPESSIPGTVDISFSDNMGNNFSNMGQFTYTDDGETELLILQLQLKMTHRALEYLHMEATGQKKNAVDIMRTIPGLGASPYSGNILMMDLIDADESIMSLNEVEESILKTLDCLPREVDISMQLDDGSNLLHLSIILGLNRLAVRLVEEGCDIEAQDSYAMTPLMYAVLKDNVTIVRILVIGGASSSGARTPEEFYELLPRTIEPTPTMRGFLSVSCTRYFGASSSAYTLGIVREERGMAGTEEEKHRVELTNSKYDTPSQGFTQSTPVSSVTAYISRVKAASPVTDSTIATCDEPTAVCCTNDVVTLLANAIQRVHTNHGIPPLDQQHLPPLHTIETDGSITINTKVIKGSEIIDANEHVVELYTNVSPESGYHSGVCSEVQEHLNRLHSAALPSEGVQMVALFKKLSPTSPAPLSMPLELFRTGDSFAIEIRLTTLEGEGQIPMPREYLGIKFPYELTKRVGGKPALILTEMTYSLNVSVELGNLSSIESKGRSPSLSAPCSYGDGIQLTGACQVCSKFLHEQRKLSPSRKSTIDPSIYPVFQFCIPGGSSLALPSLASTTVNGTATTSVNTSGSGVVELRDGACEVKAKVNCSSLHHFVQRERARRAVERSLSEETLVKTPSKSPSNKSLVMMNLRDPGFVFKFELVHPTLNKVVARYETRPILFQSYPRGRV